MADKSFGVKELNLISASGTPTITSPNSVNINATNVAISTDITVGGMVSLGAGTSISSPGTNVLTFGTNSTEKVRITSAGQLLHSRSDDTTRYDLEFRQIGGISDGNYSGIHWMQGSTGSTNLAAIEIEYANNGRPDIVFKNRQSGGTAMSEAARIASNGLVGIATAVPSYRLDIGDGATDPANGYQLRVNASGDYIFALQRQSVPSFSIRNNSTGIVHLNTQNSKILSLGVSSGNASGSIEDDVRIDSNGHLTIQDGNLVIGTSGHGIDFSATSDASGMSSEVLDDYEEGSWTPSITLGGGSTGMTYSRQEGHYTKIGRQVIGQFRITLTAKGSSTGQLRINGLPFTSADTFSSTGIDGQVHMGHDNGFNAGNVGGGAVAGYVEGGTSYFLLTRRDTNASLDTMTNTFIDNDLSISGTVIFYA